MAIHKCNYSVIDCDHEKARSEYGQQLLLVNGMCTVGIGRQGRAQSFTNRIQKSDVAMLRPPHVSDCAQGTVSIVKDES